MIRPALALAVVMLCGGARAQSLTIAEPSVVLEMPAGGTAATRTTTLAVQSGSIIDVVMVRRRRISISTSSPSQRLLLRAEVLSTPEGVTTGPVTLQSGDADQTVIRDIPANRAFSVTLRYDAEVPDGLSAGGVTEEHTVTFTITVQ